MRHGATEVRAPRASQGSKEGHRRKLEKLSNIRVLLVEKMGETLVDYETTRSTRKSSTKTTKKDTYVQPLLWPKTRGKPSLPTCKKQKTTCFMQVANSHPTLDKPKRTPLASKGAAPEDLPKVQGAEKGVGPHFLPRHLRPGQPRSETQKKSAAARREKNKDLPEKEKNGEGGRGGDNRRFLRD